MGVNTVFMNLAIAQLQIVYASHFAVSTFQIMTHSFSGSLYQILRC